MSAPALSAAAVRPPGRPSASPPRLLPPAGTGPADLGWHLGQHGSLDYQAAGRGLIAAAQAAGLTGRGGAAFPVHRKLAAVAAARGRPVVVANGAEGEPASRKDVTLLWLAPHLVLDGLQLAAAAVGAHQAFLYLHREPGGQLAAARMDRVAVEVVPAPPRFLAGQESAAVKVISGGPALPAFSPPRMSERGVHGSPTLVHNVETLAHLALIARYGPRWFRACGTWDEPGTMLCTIHQPGSQAGVTEAALGTPLRSLLAVDERTQAVLIGGYHGSWVPAAQAGRLTLASAALRPLGAGVLAALPTGRCGLAETARAARYLALESVGQCGPCVNGLPRVANALGVLAEPEPAPHALAAVARWTGMVTGRGACHHPDGTTRFVRSALTVFESELHRHARGGCSAATTQPFLPLPAPTGDWQ